LKDVVTNGTYGAVGRRCGEDLDWMPHDFIYQLSSDASAQLLVSVTTGAVGRDLRRHNVVKKNDGEAALMV
jgi:hypothetical protein